MLSFLNLNHTILFDFEQLFANFIFKVGFFDFGFSLRNNLIVKALLSFLHFSLRAFKSVFSLFYSGSSFVYLLLSSIQSLFIFGFLLRQRISPPNRLDVLRAEPGRESKAVQFWLQAQAGANARNPLELIVVLEIFVCMLLLIEDQSGLFEGEEASDILFHLLNLLLVSFCVSRVQFPERRGD